MHPLAGAAPSQHSSRHQPGSMTASPAALQAHVEEIEGQTPALGLNMAPHTLDPSDLEALTTAGGGQHAAQLARMLYAAAARLKQCQVCQRRCSSSTHSSDASDEDDGVNSLAFVAASKLDFPKRCVQVTHGVFACGRCRAARRTAQLLQLMTPGCQLVGAARWVLLGSGAQSDRLGVLNSGLSCACVVMVPPLPAIPACRPLLK